MADVAKALAEAGTQGATQFGPFGRLALDPRKLSDVAAALFGMAKAPVDAAQNIRENYRPGAENEVVNQDIGRQAFDAGSVAMAGAPFAEANALGSFGGKINNPIKAYHGSPYDFDAFDAAHIGKGEGAQAFGHGLYFAENEGVARTYRAPEKTYPHQTTNDDLNEFLLRQSGDIDKVITRIKRELGTFDRSSYRGNASHQWYENLLRDAERYRSGDPTIIRPDATGHMYEVTLHAEPHQFLDWDKPLSQQPVKDKMIEALSDQTFTKDYWENVINSGAMDTGKFAQTYLGENRTKALAEAGIPGIRYKDQLSRGAPADLQQELATWERSLASAQARKDSGDIAKFSGLVQETRDRISGNIKPTSNYVVFPGNEDLIEIVRKYGIAGLLAAGAAMPDQGENY